MCLNFHDNSHVLSLEERTKESKVFKGNFYPGIRDKTADISSLHALFRLMAERNSAQNAAIAAEDFFCMFTFLHTKAEHLSIKRISFSAG